MGKGPRMRRRLCPAVRTAEPGLARIEDLRPGGFSRKDRTQQAGSQIVGSRKANPSKLRSTFKTQPSICLCRPYQ